MRQYISTTLLVSAFVFGSMAALAGEVTPVQQPQKRSGPSTFGTGNAKWIGFAASPQGRIFKTSNSPQEAAARSDAKNECEQATQRTCRAIAVTDMADVVALKCSSMTFLGGSTQGNQVTIASTKAQEEGFDPANCSVVYNY